MNVGKLYFCTVRTIISGLGLFLVVVLNLHLWVYGDEGSHLDLVFRPHWGTDLYCHHLYWYNTCFWGVVGICATTGHLSNGQRRVETYAR